MERPGVTAALNAYLPSENRMVMGRLSLSLNCNRLLVKRFTQQLSIITISIET
jgi:hypothetical protein